MRLVVFAEVLDDLAKTLLVFGEEGFQCLVRVALHLGGHQPVDECAIVEADGNGLVSINVAVKQAVVFLLLIVIQPAVIRCMVGVHFLFEALVEHAFHMVDTLAEDGGAEGKGRHIAFASFDVVGPDYLDVVSARSLLVVEGFVAE